MARKRLAAILSSTILSVGVLALPAGALELDAGTVTETVSTTTESVEEELATTSEELVTAVEDTTTSVTDTTEETVDDPEGTVENPEGTVEDTVDDLTGTTEELPTGGDDGDDDPEPATRTSSRTYRSSGEGVQPAPSAQDPVVAPGRSRTFDRSHLSSSRQGGAAVGASTGASAASEVAAPEIAAPEVAPAAGEEQVLALPASAPDVPGVPAPLRVLATALVLSAAGSWAKAWHETRA